MPITQTILTVADCDPQQPAIVGFDPAEHLTYAELVEDSKKVFAAVSDLHDQQASPPHPARETQDIPITAVSLYSAFQTSRIIAGLAGFRSVSATIDPRWPLEDQVRIIHHAGIGLVISDSTELAAALSTAGWSGTVVSLAEFQNREHEYSPQQTNSQQVPTSAAAGAVETPVPPELEAPQVRDSAEPFLMLFSSGTTSAPKAFIKTRGQYRANVAVSSAHLEPGPGVATLAPGPVSYSLTLYALIECLANGGSCHVTDEFSALEASAHIAQHRITRMVCVPAVVYALAVAAGRDPERFTTVDLLVAGGANLPVSIREKVSETLPQAQLISYYGAAEIGFIGDSRADDGTLISIYDEVSCQVRGLQSGLTSSSSTEASAGAEGSGEVQPLPGRELPEGELGTVWIRADSCSDGYVSTTTSEHLVGADGWATVHDQGRMVGGRLALVGRAGDVVVTGGHKVALPEVERAFENLPGAGTVCAIGLDSDTLGTAIGVVFEGNRDDLPAKAQLLQHARQHLAPQFVPQFWYCTQTLPRTVGGKIRRNEATEQVQRQAENIERIR